MSLFFRFSHAMNKKCNWAFCMFQTWVEERNLATENDLQQVKISSCLLDMCNCDLVYAITQFIVEVCKKNGSEYPAETLYEFIVSLQLWLHMRGKCVKFLDDPDFAQIRNCLDNRMKELSRHGIVQLHNQADVITVEDETVTWAKNILGSSNPKQLVDTLLYLFGVHFALCAGVEHRAMHVGDNSQITLHNENGVKCLLYHEDVSKTHQGGLDHCKILPKKVQAYENIANPECCIVKLYQKYLSVHPKGLKTNDFYLHPVAVPHGNVWYSCQPIGKNTLTKIVAEIAKKAGIDGKLPIIVYVHPQQLECIILILTNNSFARLPVIDPMLLGPTKGLQKVSIRI